MKKIFVLMVIFIASAAWAAPNTAEYTVNVHVVSSRLLDIYEGGLIVGYQQLDVVIGGKKYELQGDFIPIKGKRKCKGLLVPGDYKARITDSEHNGTYADCLGYEFLFPDQTTAKFGLSGETE